ncbi:transglycosylase family protein [Arthrobacter sp. zg-Y820]|uniref:resuscitation-promoting factor n=1 Tax=unclassified Arthrobacter TaxID=235627 RepID=UPI001E383A68|nr:MULTISPECIES: resuscitation-promoting factor [unclassified Arthrobacter]MCC9197973.1 transglycosylase family protein [Arthrobacter sp. zg-Y820]MDK1280840.1 transglycosylase family protein [Arthrobacter sp. zg.Y820]WIB10320.1 transglycosylase family protein [Arthrobacter sp. zg-Y820]
MVALILGLVAFVGTNKSVSLTVDGQSSDVKTFGGTVAEVLQKADVQVTAADRVSPDLATEVTDGASIEVFKAKTVDVTLDGEGHTVSTTGQTVADLVSELRVASNSAVSASLDTELTGLDDPISISTPKTVTMVLDGKSYNRPTTAGTVAELLDEAGITLAATDRLSAPSTAALADGMALKVTRVQPGEKDTVAEPVPYKTTEVPDPNLLEGEKKVTVKGTPGEIVRVFDTVLVDGREASRTLVSETVAVPPTDEKIAVGTKKKPAKPAKPAPAPAPASASAPASPGGAAPAGGNWAALAQCESGGDWHINTGNGYSGGLQFSASSWLGAGGGQYAPIAAGATPAQQIAVAEKLRANGGWGHWPSCAAKLGLL